MLPIVVNANDNGLALSPPLGWRSWNLYRNKIDQTKMMRIMDGMVKKTRRLHPNSTTLLSHNNNPLVSLCDLGYCDVGLDDMWQECNGPDSAPGMHYHAINGTPLVNTQRFPSLRNMTAHAHALKLTAGWYANNCDCHDTCRTPEECELQIRGDVAALIDYDFDGLKIDGCGNETDLVLWNQVVTELTDRPLLLENCHNINVRFKPNRTLPPALGCPYHMYRTSFDIRNFYASIMSNLGTIEPYYHRNQSYPGCWAYLDMLMIGIPNEDTDSPDKYGLSEAEMRTHFGAWAIVSSPLILSHDVNDQDVTNHVWDLISNTEVLEVNQAYVGGDAGGLYHVSEEYVTLVHTGKYEWSNMSVSLPRHQYFAKPLRLARGGSGGVERVAVLLVNSGSEASHMSINFHAVPGLEQSAQSLLATDETNTADKTMTANNSCHTDSIGNSYHIRNLWKHEDVGVFACSWSTLVDAHDAAFVVVERAKESEVVQTL